MNTLKWLITNDKRQTRRSIIIMTSAFSIIVLANLMPNITMRTPLNEHNALLSPAITFISLFSTVFLMSNVLRMVSKVEQQGQLAQFLLLPASNKEKYVSLVVKSVLMSIGVIIASLLLTDAIIAIISLMFCGNAISITWHFLDGNIFFMTRLFQEFNSVEEVLCVTSWTAMTIAFGLLVATLFRKHHIMFAMAIFFGVPFFFIFVIGAVFPMIGDIDWEWLESFLRDTDRVEMILKSLVYFFFIILPACLSVVFTWLSYRKFCRMQIINNRIYN